MITRKIIGYGLVAVMFALAFVACESPTDETAHVHDYAWSVTTPATCIATGVETGVCKLDPSHTDTREIPIDTVNGHDWGEWEGTVTCTTAGTGTRTCSRSPTTHIETDDSLQPLGHAYNDEDWEETESPTCSKKGKEEANCVRYAACGNTGTRDIAIDPDAHDWQISSGTAPTCTTDGSGVEICSYNAEHILSGVLPKLGHTFENYVQTLAATCSAQGSKTADCIRKAACGVTDTQTIPIDPTAHDWNITYTTITSANETTDGLEAITCTHNNAHTKEPRTLYATGTAGLSYALINSNAAYSVYKGTVTSGAVHIPAFWRGNSTDYADYKPVTEISNSSFQNSTITAVTFSANSQLASIGNQAFYSCTSLTGITIPNSVTNIGDLAFFSCTSLTSIVLPASVTNIGSEVFSSCTSLTAITVDANNPNYASQDGILYNKAKTELIVVPKGITGSVTIPATVTSIGQYAFDQCYKLTAITIPASVATIGEGALRGCTGLASITVDTNNPNYASQDGILYNKAKTSFVLIPQAISGNITISTGITSIGDDDGNPSSNNTFSGCTKLTNITIPASVTSIGSQTFSGCDSLTSITVDNANPNYSSNGGILYNKAQTVIVQVPIAISGNVTLPASLTTITDGAFSSCTSLTNITIPADVTAIGAFAFSYCESLASITIPASVTSIGAQAFSYCTSLTEITIPASVTSIGNYVFNYWTASQTINIAGYASETAADAAWGTNWKVGCNAIRMYLQSDGTYQ